RLAEFMARVPSNLKIRGRKLRYLEMRLADRYLPPSLLRRPKQGFASPLMYVLDEEVRRLAPLLLLNGQLIRDGYLFRHHVSHMLQEHLARQIDHGNRIWLLLSAEIWYRQYIGHQSNITMKTELETGPRRPSVSQYMGSVK